MELLIQYRVKPDKGDEQAEAIKGFVASIAELDSENIRYRAYRLPDGVSFKHLVWIADEETKTKLQAQHFFQEFAENMQPRCDEAPTVTPLSRVAATTE